MYKITIEISFKLLFFISCKKKVIINYILPFAISASSCEFVTTLGSLLRALVRFG